jgi:hypothetical protein
VSPGAWLPKRIAELFEFAAFSPALQSCKMKDKKKKDETAVPELVTAYKPRALLG